MSDAFDPYHQWLGIPTAEQAMGDFGTAGPTNRRRSPQKRTKRLRDVPGWGCPLVYVSGSDLEHAMILSRGGDQRSNKAKPYQTRCWRTTRTCDTPHQMTPDATAQWATSFSS